VLYKCGEPEYITGKKKEVKGTFASGTEYKRSTSYTTGGYQQEEIKTEIWHYNCGDNDFVYALTFEDNVLVKEDTPTRGYGKSKCISVKYLLQDKNGQSCKIKFRKVARGNSAKLQNPLQA
jgi:hypothetical protein